MVKLNTYLNFAGNTKEAFDFYKSVFGGEFTSVVRFKDMPIEGVNISKKDENKIMHISLPIGKDTVLMATDTLDSLGQKLRQGNNVYISIHPESKEEADRIFNALCAGGTVEMQMADQTWGDYFGSLKDKFGVQWMINYSYSKNQQGDTTMAKTITVESIINASVEKVWRMWTEPKHIVNWAFASDDWEAPVAENDVRVGGKFKTVMATKDKSRSFDFTGKYTAVIINERIEYVIDDGRKVSVRFESLNGNTKVTETFEIEKVNSESLQRDGWQAILDNFKKYTEVS